jgi:hypothetical protein
MKHKLDLRENAISSLEEALLKYEEGSATNLSAYKFAILHFAHFFELLFKHYVTLSHELLIYKNPFSKNIAKENTIGLWEAVQFLKNEGKVISKEFNADLEWIKRLRNNIEHFKFELDAIEVRNILGRLIRAADEFVDENGLVVISSFLSGEHLRIYTELGDEYKAKLSTAKIEAESESEDSEGHLCNICGESSVAAKIGSEFHCKLCEEIDRLVECCQCNDEFRESETMVWNDDHPPLVDYICGFCEERIMDMG